MPLNLLSSSHSPCPHPGDPLKYLSLQELDYGALYEVRTPHFYVEANKMPMARVRGQAGVLGRWGGGIWHFKCWGSWVVPPQIHTSQHG